MINAGAFTVTRCAAAERTRTAPVATGASLELEVSGLLGAGPAPDRAAESIVALLADGHEVAVKLELDGDARGRGSRFVAACGRLGRYLSAAGVDARRLGLIVDAAAVSPLLAWQSRRSMLGAGRVEFLIGKQDIAPAAGDPVRVRRRWFELWRLRDAATSTAIWPEARSACALLAAEPADALLPPLALQAPRGSAWLAYPLGLDRLPARHGLPDDDAFRSIIRQALEDAGERFETTDWPSPRQAEDAWFNRRVALVVHGIGNVARRAGLDPRSPRTFVELDRLLADIRRIAFDCARQSVGASGPLPAIDASNPCRQVASGAMRDAWRVRWRCLVEETAIAHRNLVVMSPWSLFPDDDADVRYAGLLPLLRHADACVFARRPSLHAWSLDEYIDLHRQAWPLCGHSAGRPIIAEQP